MHYSHYSHCTDCAGMTLQRHIYANSDGALIVPVAASLLRVRPHRCDNNLCHSSTSPQLLLLRGKGFTHPPAQ